MTNQVAQKVAEVMTQAANSFKAGGFVSFADAVGVAFWGSFSDSEQSPLMQGVYVLLCEMGFTPLERG